MLPVRSPLCGKGPAERLVGESKCDLNLASIGIYKIIIVDVIIIVGEFAVVTFSVHLSLIQPGPVRGFYLRINHVSFQGIYNKIVMQSYLFIF